MIQGNTHLIGTFRISSEADMDPAPFKRLIPADLFPTQLVFRFQTLYRHWEIILKILFQLSYRCGNFPNYLRRFCKLKTITEFVKKG